MDNIEKLQEKVSKDPTSRLFVPLAEEYRKAGRYDEAIEVLKTGIEHQPGYMSARAALGKIYLEMNKKLEAREEFEKVTREVPDNLFAQRKLADIYRELGWVQDAVRQYKTVLKLNPLDEESRAHLIALEGPGAGEEAAWAAGPTEEEVSEAAAEIEALSEAEEEATDAERVWEEEPGFPEPTEEAVCEVSEEEAPLGEAPEEGEAEIRLEELQGEDVETIVQEAARREGEEGLPDFSETDTLVARGEYVGAMNSYQSMLSQEPGNREVLQRVEELRTLLKLLGRENEIYEANLGSFLEGIKKRRDEFFRGP